MQLFFVCLTWLNKQQQGGREKKKYKRTPLPLFLSKSFSFLDGKEQLLFQLFIAFVRRQVQTVKTEETNREKQRSAWRQHDTWLHTLIWSTRTTIRHDKWVTAPPATLYLYVLNTPSFLHVLDHPLSEHTNVGGLHTYDTKRWYDQNVDDFHSHVFIIIKIIIKC